MVLVLLNKKKIKIESAGFYFFSLRNNMPTTITTSYTAYAVFTIPKKYRNLPKENFEVKYAILYITTLSGEIVEIEPHNDPQDCINWKRGNGEEFDANEPEEDEEEEEED